MSPSPSRVPVGGPRPRGSLSDHRGEQVVGVVLQPVGAVPEPLVRRLAEAVADVLALEPSVRSALPWPSPTCAPERLQRHALRLLHLIAEQPRDPSTVLLGVADADLYVPDEAFVLGVFNRPSRASVVGLARLRQEFWGLPADEGLFRTRVVKLALHQLGHALGLRHCTSGRCVMGPTPGLLGLDDADAAYCRACRASLAALDAAH